MNETRLGIHGNVEFYPRTRTVMVWRRTVSEIVSNVRGITPTGVLTPRWIKVEVYILVANVARHAIGLEMR